MYAFRSITFLFTLLAWIIKNGYHESKLILQLTHVLRLFIINLFALVDIAVAFLKMHVHPQTKLMLH
jgi:hypothetical protein